MDLLKSLDYLGTTSLEAQDSEDIRKQKTNACRVVADQLCTPLLRNSSDFPRFLSVGSASLIRMTGDDDINVRIVAAECLNKLIIELIDSYPERILFELYKVIKKGKSSGRAQREALLKFSEICHYIKPTKSRKYLTSLLDPLSDIILEGDEPIQEVLAIAMEKICATLIFYLKDREVQQLLELLVKNMYNPSAPIRRSASSIIVSICRHAPVSPTDFVISLLLKPFQEGDTVDTNYLFGVLHTLLQIVKVSFTELGDKQTSVRHPVLSHLTFFFSLIAESVTHEDHNVIGASLELLNQILLTYGKIPQIWGTQSEAKKAMREFITICYVIIQNESMRTSTKAVAISCFSAFARSYTTEVIEYFNAVGLDIQTYMSNQLQHSDPLMRGQAGLFIGCIVSGYLDQCSKENVLNPLTESKKNEAIIPLLELLLTSISDSSSVAVKLMCKGLGKILKSLTNSYSTSLFRENERWTTTIVTKLLSVVNNETYWLVKVEMLLSLSKINFRVFHMLQRWNPEEYIRSALDDMQHLQSRIIDFITAQFDDNDVRVRNNAATSLIKLLPRLWFGLQLELTAPIPPSSQLEILLTEQIVEVNMSHIVKILLTILEKSHSINEVKGAYYALLLLSQKYYNKIGNFLGDIIVLVMDNLNCCSWLVIDLDVHVQVIQTIGYLSKQKSRNLNKYSLLILRHLLRVISVLTGIVQNRPLPSKDRPDASPGGNTGNLPLGYFASEGLFLKLMERLQAARNAHSSASVTTDALDKFSQFRSTCFASLANLIESMGKEIVPFAEEILGYLSPHFEAEPTMVMQCMKELFSCIFDFSKELQSPVSPPSSPGELRPIENNKQAFIYERIYKVNTVIPIQEYKPINIKDITKVVSGTKNKGLLRFFEPLVVKGMQKYQISHQIDLKQVTLSFFTELVHFGVDFTRLDKEYAFLNFVINEITGKNCYLPHPPLLLPSMFDFLGGLYITKRVPTTILSNEKILLLISFAFSSPNWNSNGALLITLKQFIQFLFATQHSSEEEEGNFKEVKEHVFSRIMGKITQPEAVKLLVLILMQCKSSKDSLIELDWKGYSQQIGNKILPILSGNTKERMAVESIEDIGNLYSLFDNICMTTISPIALIESILAITTIDKQPESLNGDTLNQIPYQKFYWLPGLLTLLRGVCAVREEKLISAMEQLSAKYKDTQPELILPNFIFKIIKSTTILFKESTTTHRVQAQLFAELLHLTVFFLNGDNQCKRPRILMTCQNSVAESLLQNLSEISSIIFAIGNPQYTLIFSKILLLLNQEQMLLPYLSTSETNISWTKGISKMAIFLTYCQSLATKGTTIIVEPESALLRYLFLHANEPIVKQAVRILAVDNANVFIQYVQKNFGQELLLSNKYQMMEILQQISPSIELLRTVILLLNNPQGYLVQIFCFTILKKNLEAYKIALQENQVVDGNFEDLQKLQIEFSESRFGQYNTQLQALFSELVSLLPKEYHTKKNEDVVYKLSDMDDISSILAPKYTSFAKKPFMYLNLLACIDFELFVKMLKADQLNVELIPAFLATKESLPFFTHMEQFLASQISKILNEQNSVEWGRALNILKSVTAFYLHYKPQIITQETTLAFIVRGFQSFMKLLTTNMATPADSLALLQLVIVLVEKEDYEMLSKSSIWMELLTEIQKFYVIATESGFIKLATPQVIKSGTNPLSYFLSQLKKDYMRSFELNGPTIHQSFYEFFLTLAKKNLDKIYPSNLSSILSGEFDGINPEEMDQSFEDIDPEKLLTNTIKMIDIVGWKTSQQFLQLWDSFFKLLKVTPAPAEIVSQGEEVLLPAPDLTDGIQYLALAGLTSLLLRACLFNRKGKKLGDDTTSGPFIYYPREKEIAFLKREQGVRLSILQTAIDTAMLRSQYSNSPQIDSIISDIQQLGLRITGQSFKQSPYHANVERFPTHTGPQRYDIGQISIFELRQNNIQKLVWQDLGLSDLLVKLLRLLQVVVENESAPSLLRMQAFRSIVDLSDLFTPVQFEWMLDLFIKLHTEQLEDFLIKQYIVLGVCKAAAVVPLLKSHHYPNVAKIIKASLELDEPVGSKCVQLALLKGLLYLLEAQQTRIIFPFLGSLFKYLSSALQERTTVIRLYTMSVICLLIEEFSKDAEDQGFSGQAVQQFINQATSKENSIDVMNCIYRGLGRLLISFSLSQTHRDAITSFASKNNKALLKFHVANSIRSLLALGLMITCMYTADEGKNEEHQNIVDGDSTTYLDNMERIKLLFVKVNTRGFPHEVEALVNIIPSLLLDLFPLEQAFSFVLGEFLRQLNGEGFPELIAVLIFKFFELAREKNNGESVFHWVSICLHNFIQVKPTQKAIWAISCLLLSASQNTILQTLFREIVVRMEVDEQIFLLAGVKFYIKIMEPKAKETFVSIFREATTRDKLFEQMAILCEEVDLIHKKANEGNKKMEELINEITTESKEESINEITTESKEESVNEITTENKEESINEITTESKEESMNEITIENKEKSINEITTESKEESQDVPQEEQTSI